MPRDLYRIRIRRGDAELEIEGDKEYVTKLFRDLRPMVFSDTAVSPLPSPSGSKTTRPAPPLGLASKPQSAREFLDSYDISRHTDFVLAFGFYLEKVRDLGGFTGADIDRCYYEAKIEPSNTSQMIIQNIKKGFMMEAPGSKEGKRKYVLTRKGEEFVGAGFSKTKK